MVMRTTYEVLCVLLTDGSPSASWLGCPPACGTGMLRCWRGVGGSRSVAEGLHCREMPAGPPSQMMMVSRSGVGGADPRGVPFSEGDHSWSALSHFPVCGGPCSSNNNSNNNNNNSNSGISSNNSNINP